MNPLESRLTADLQALDRRSLRRRLQTRAAGAPTVVEFAGRRLVNFASNDYLGLAGDARIAEALAGGAQRWGVGAGAAHLLGGHTLAHAAFEEALADFLGREAALLFSTGYLANLGLVGALAGRGDTVVEDRLDHASLIDGALLSRARLVRYSHADVKAAAQCMAVAKGRVLLASDGTFSMDGDLAPLPALAQAACTAGATLVIDDAHGFGVLGGGRGTVAHFGLGVQDVPALVVTFGKALGVFGAAVAGSRELIETLVNRARPYIYTTALPPAIAEALATALVIVRDEDWRRVRVAALVTRFREACGAVELTLGNSPTPIQPVMIGDSGHALAISQALADRGFYVPAIRPPTIPAGTARLRISLSAAHEEAQVEGLVAALAEVLHR